MAKFEIRLNEGKVTIPYLYDTGVYMYDVKPETRYEYQVFSFKMAKINKMFHFDIHKLAAIARTNPAIKRKYYGIPPEQAVHLIANNGIEREHLDREVLLAKINVPGIIVTWPTGEQVVVDGNHRFVRRYLMGLTTMRFYDFTFHQARKTLLDVPAEFSEWFMGGNSK